MTTTAYTARELTEALARVTTAPVSVEMTGGGCATLYVGEPNATGYALLAIGPGAYRGWDSEFDFAQDLVVGPDEAEGGQHDTLARDLDHLLVLVQEWIATLDSALLTEPLAGDVEDIAPGTPAWDVSEQALDLQRRRGE